MAIVTVNGSAYTVARGVRLYAKLAKILELSSDPVFAEEYMERMMC